MLRFDNYLAFLLLLLIPLWIILKHFGILRNYSFPLLFSDWEGRSFEWKEKSFRFFAVFSKVLFTFAFIFAVIALANPKIAHQEKRYVSRGTEIIFVLDSSPSMSAIDMGEKTRLALAKEAIASVTSEMPETSFGLVAMATDAACLVPPSMDSEVFNKQLESIKIGALGDGTALGVGISTAVYHLSSSVAPQKGIVLITDGENNDGTIHPFTAAKMAAEFNIPVYVLGVGTTGTVPVEYTDPNTGKTYSGYLESGFDSASLEKIASLTKGVYFDIRSVQDLKEVLLSVIRNESVVPHFYIVSVDDDYYEIFIYLSMGCILLGWIIKRIYLKEVIL